ncbi:hypothetical protein B9G55_11120 [Saccharibacillus sp. O16]|nr:hypothetical protein B9G55_11120 [Saccharibacillus sp. O16]
MLLNNQTVDPWVEKFAKACSEEYSLAVDRRDSIIEYVTGKTDQFPDLLPESNYYTYRTSEALGNLGRQDSGDVFYRAAAVVLRSRGRRGRDYQDQALYRVIMGDELDGINLGSSQVQDVEERLDRTKKRLVLLHKYAGEEVIHRVFSWELGLNPGQAGKDASTTEITADTLLRLKLYADIDPAFTRDILSKLAPSLQALVAGDADALRKELLKAIEPIVIQQLPLKDTLTQLDLAPEYVEARREEVKARLFPHSSLDPKESLRREKQGALLRQVRCALYYRLLLNGGKQGLLESSLELDKTVLDVVRDVHEILPLEMREELLMTERSGKNPDAVLQGVVRTDEPFTLLTTLSREIDGYMPTWNMLRNELLKEERQAKRLFAILRRPLLKAYVYRVLSDAGMAPESEKSLEQLVLESLSDKLYGNVLGQSLAKLLSGELSMETYLKHKPSQAWDDIRGNNNRRRNLLVAVMLLPEDSEPYARFVKLAGQPAGASAAFLSCLYHSPYFRGDQLLEQVEQDPDGDENALLRQLLFLNGSNSYYFARVPYEELQNMVRRLPERVLDLYPDLHSEVRQTVVETVLEDIQNEETLIRAMRFGLGDSSKRIREIVRTELLSRQDKDLCVKLYLSEKKVSVRESVIDLLRGTEGEGEAYQELLQKEKSEALKARLQALLDTLGKPAEFAHAALADHMDAKKLARLSWLSLDQLPELSARDGHKLDDRIKAYVLGESVEFVSEPNPRLSEVEEYADGTSLAAFAAEVLRLWIDAQAPAKEKWVLPLAARFGGRPVIDLLGRQIKDWTDNSRGAIASDAVRALAFMNDTAALMTIDKLGRAIKNRQVRGAAEEALQLAAENQGLTKEQLADRLVTSLGFDEQGELKLSYGERSFTVKVNGDLQLSAVSDETGKAVKNLPAPGQKDDAELAAQSKSRFTQLKKDLKTMVGIQSQRLEESLSKQRLWSAEEWIELFVHNVIMRQFAVGLIWGVYEGSREDSTITATFRYMEDGTFNTVDEDEYELPGGAKIGLVHPLELDKDTLDAWKSQLEDYEIVQPFVQLNRPSYLPTEEELELRAYNRLPEGEFSPTGFPKALERYGWVKGRAMDGGFYNELFKAYGDLIARLTFSGTSIAYYEGMEDVTLEELEFFANKGDDYYYAPASGHVLKNVPERVFSETVYDILRASGQPVE